MKQKIRLDQLLVSQKWVDSIEKARSFIMQGKVLVNDQKILKSGILVQTTALVRLLGEELRYVSRGGLKLEGAHASFNFDIKHRVALDVGISTGGFSDFLLQQGVKTVIGIDVGYGQVASPVATNSNAIVIERVNARLLTRDIFEQKLIDLNKSISLLDDISLVVMDVSFISIITLIPVLQSFLKPGVEGVFLVKPQFESSQDKMEEGGIIRNDKNREDILNSVLLKIATLGCTLHNTCLSPIHGAKGNQEYFIHITL